MFKADTIFALATAPGRAAIAVIRISGEKAHDALCALVNKPVPSDRAMHLRVLRDPATGDVIDQALIVLFPESSSPTGQRYGELHLHGGVMASAAALKVLGSMDGLRSAAPGEFARRSFDNDRLDLLQIEGIADLVEAQTEAQRRQAMKLVQRGLTDRVAEWRSTLIDARASVEAVIDFSDDDLPSNLLDEALVPIAALSATMKDMLRGARAGSIVREGLEIAIIGPPNAGKSSLINLLSGRDIALTSPAPGTTRDVLEARCAIQGYLVTFLDTAGLRDTADPIEQAGVALARRRAKEADLRLIVWAPDCPQDPLPAENDILVWNKADIEPGPGVNVSTRSGEGVEKLVCAIAGCLSGVTAQADMIVRERHRQMLETAVAHLEGARTSDVELCAEELRLATQALDNLIGGVDCDEVLGQIFSQLCIGK